MSGGPCVTGIYWNIISFRRVKWIYHLCVKASSGHCRIAAWRWTPWAPSLNWLVQDRQWNHELMEQVGSFKSWKGSCWHGLLRYSSITVNLHSSLLRLVRRRWEAHNACQCLTVNASRDIRHGEMRGETLFQRNRLAKNLGLAWAVISVTLMMWLLD